MSPGGYSEPTGQVETREDHASETSVCEGEGGVGLPRKVMSAGVLLLAAGTKGRRKIGQHCRVMIHGVNSGHSGYIADMENEFAETKFTQKQYVAALAAETDMTPAYIRKLMGKKTNVYLDAQQAVDLGIADIIV